MREGKGTNVCTAQRTTTDCIAVSEIQLDTDKLLSQLSEIKLSLVKPVRFWKEDEEEQGRHL